MNLKQQLVKPYVTLEFDEGKSWKIPLTTSAFERLSGTTEVIQKLVRDLQSGTYVEDAVLKAFQWIAGDEMGADIYETCMGYLLEGDEDLTEAESIYQLTPVVVALYEEITEHFEAMGLRRAEKFAKYLGTDNGLHLL